MRHCIIEGKGRRGEYESKMLLDIPVPGLYERSAEEDVILCIKSDIPTII